MSQYDSADLLARLRRDVREPTTADFPATADLYAWLAQGQIDVFQRLAMAVPDAVIGAPTQMTTADSGQTYTFGTDSAAPTNYTAIFPVGHVRIFGVLSDLPDNAWVEGVDYAMEGDRIRRLPADQPYTGAAPYYQGIALPLTLDGSVAPTLEPVAARELIVDFAAIRYAEAVPKDPQPYLDRSERHWQTWIGALQTQYARRGAVAATNPWSGGPRRRYVGGRPFGFRWR